MPPRLRTSLADIEQAFAQEVESDRLRREEAVRQAELRSRRRQIERAHKRGSMRFALLITTLVTTAVLVTLAMFQALYWVMG